MLHGPTSTQNNARALRKTMTLPEVLLWRELRRRPARLRFRRQHPAGAYVLDFFCPAINLAIEVDGEAHNRGDRPAKDERRDAWLAAQGVLLVRIPARDVLERLDAVVAMIAAMAPAARYPSTSFAGPPPPRGEE